MAYVANTTIKRGTRIMALSPVLVVHKDFFEEVRKAADQDRLLDAALKPLPWATRQKFNAQRVEKSTGHKVKDAVMGRAFELDMRPSGGPQDDANEKHYLNYPEGAAFTHDCRPNLAYHIDGHLAFQAVAARKILPGEELTIVLTDPFSAASSRKGQIKKATGHACTCSQCTGGGNIQELKKSDERLKEIKGIEAHLKDHTSEHVTSKMIERLVELLCQGRAAPGQTRVAVRAGSAQLQLPRSPQGGGQVRPPREPGGHHRAGAGFGRGLDYADPGG